MIQILKLEFIYIIQMEAHTPKNFPKYQYIYMNGIACQTILASYGAVNIAKSAETGQLVIIKKLNYKFSEDETILLRHISHQNIVNLIDCFIDHKTQQTFLVLEYTEGRTLYDFIKFTPHKEKHLIHIIFSQVQTAVEYLHRQKIFYLDLKPENIIVSPKFKVKICFFGISLNQVPRMSRCRNLQYYAPEIIFDLPYNNKVDMWSLGILLYQMIEGRPPFQGHSKRQMQLAIKNCRTVFSDNFTEQQINMISCLLRVCPKQRLISAPARKSLTTTAKQITKDESTLASELVTEKKIKLIEIKSVEKQAQKKNSSPSIHIVSMKRLTYQPSPEKTQYKREELLLQKQKLQNRLALNKNKISLKLYTKRGQHKQRAEKIQKA